MIHSWNPEIAVRPRTAAIVEENGLFLSNYVLMIPKWLFLPLLSFLRKQESKGVNSSRNLYKQIPQLDY